MIVWILEVGLLAFDLKDDGGKCHVIDLPKNEMGRLGVSFGHLQYYEVSRYVPWEPTKSHFKSMNIGQF